MSKVAKATAALMAVTMLSKIMGFGRELVLGALYGASTYSDIFIAASNIPKVLFTLVATALATTFIPLYYENLREGGEDKALRFSNNILNITIILGIILSTLSFIFAGPIVKIFAMGFKGETFRQAVIFTRIIIFGAIFTGLSDIMKSYLQSKGSFTIPGLIGLPYNIILIGAMILSVVLDNVYILPVGALLAMASQFFFQVPFAYKKGYKYRLFVDFKDEYVKKMLILVAPIVIGVAVDQINIMVDKTLASTLVEGSISALNYADRLKGFVTGMFIASISAVVYPQFSRLSAAEDRTEFFDFIRKSINSVIIIIMPMTIGAMVLSQPIVRILFQRGAFDARATQMTAIALVFYSVGLIGVGLRDILTKIFYSVQDTKTPMINATIAVVMNICMNLIFIRHLKHGGLALATSLSSIICILLLFRSLKKKLGDFGQKKIIIVFFKTTFAALIMGVVARVVYKFIFVMLGTGLIMEVIALGTAIVAGATVYGLLILLFKVDEVSMITDIVKKKLKRG